MENQSQATDSVPVFILHTHLWGSDAVRVLLQSVVTIVRDLVFVDKAEYPELTPSLFLFYILKPVGEFFILE